ncbi:Peroxisomal membrane protein PMP27 [Vanrija albida]|uniref:Peroxisomal membrane protein PMP27 n=1 Tax=Vanrija albida TaxID=181172 RepID=A0ABR3PSL8_9TREE
MATIISQVVLHPKVSQALAVLATTIGRDKLYRLIQYVSRILAWSFARSGAPDLAARFDGLKGALGMGRKLMRVFKPVENLQSALNISQRPFTGITRAETLAQVTQLGRQIAYAIFLGTDSIVWLQFSKFLHLDKDKAARIQQISNKAWFIGLVLSLVSSGASLVNLRHQSRRFALQSEVSRREGGEKGPDQAAAEEAERRKQGRALLAQRQTLLSQIVTDSFDIWIPSNNLGYSHLSEGAVGLLGATTSYMALQKVWNKHGAAVVAKLA